MLEKAGGLSSTRVGADIPGPWLLAVTRRGEAGLIPREELLAQSKCLFSWQDSLGETCPTGLAAESRPARHMQGG